MPTVVGDGRSENGVRGLSDFDDGIFGRSNARFKSGVFGLNTSRAEAAFGVSGETDSPDGAGVNGFSRKGVGVRGATDENDGIVGSTFADGKSGVFGFNGDFSAGFGVSGTANSRDGVGVNGSSKGGVGVKGTSQGNDGIVGSSGTFGKSGVYGFNSGHNFEAFGVSGSTDSPDGAGVNGFSNFGYGGFFSGKRAPLRLIPATNTVGRPDGPHQRGELFVDSIGDLFYCKADGRPGTWYKVRLDPA